MAGHSKFKNIMHRKGAQDARRAKKFARLIKELQVAARSSTDPESNPRLRTALSACKSANMPKDNIQRVLNKANSGEPDNLEDIKWLTKKIVNLRIFSNKNGILNNSVLDKAVFDKRSGSLSWGKK